MAQRFTDEVVEEQTAVVTTAKDVLPENVVTLTSGVKVQFLKPLPSAIAQNIVIASFNDMNIGDDGRVRDNMSSQEQLAVAKKMYDYNAALLINGLVKGCIKVYPEMPTDTKWLKTYKLNPLISVNHPYLNFDDETDVEFLYLFYEGFIADTDYQILSDKLLNR